METQEKTAKDWAREAEELRARLSEEVQAAETLRARLEEAEETLRAIREGEVDALLISTSRGERVYTLEGADHTYRLLVESMQQGAATLIEDGSIFYSNQHLARLLKTPLQQLIGASIHTFVHSADAPLFADLVKQARQCSSEGELRLETADGILIPVYVALNRLELGERTGICLAVTDLTATAAAERLALANAKLEQEVRERKCAEDALRESEERLRLLGDNLPDSAVYQYIHEGNGCGRFLHISAGIERLNGVRAQDVLRDAGMVHRQILPEYFERLMEAEARCVRELSDFDMEVPMLRPDGQLRWMRLHSRPRRLPDGRLVWDGVQTDITEQRRAEEALRESESRYRLLFDRNPDGVFTVDASGRFILANAACEAISGFTVDELRQKTFMELCAPDQLARTVEHFQRGLSQPHYLELETALIRKDGGRVELWIAGEAQICDGKVVGIHCTAKDITERKRAEAGLAETKERLQRVLATITEGYYVLDSEWRFVEMNAVAEQHFGRPAAELQGKNIWEETGMQPGAVVFAKYHEAARAQQPTSFEAESRVRPGSWSELHLHPRDGQLDVYFHDISERMRAQEAMRESEERFRTAFANGAIAMALTALDNSFLQVNSAFCQMLGFSDAELVGRRFTDITHPDDIAENRAGTQRMLRGETSSFRMEKRYLRKDGNVIWGDMCTTFVKDGQGKPLYFVTHVQDITERKQAQDALITANAQLAEADRRKDEFLAMLAHELRNPLAPVRNAVQILRAVGSTDPKAQCQQDVIDRQVTHMARLLDDLLDVSRVTRGKINLERQPLPLIDVLAHALEITTPLIQARRHELSYTPPTDVLLVEGDLDRLAQVFGNLLTNAAKYTEAGGRIWLEAACEDGQVVVRVRDNGVGIASDLLPRVFDLFAQADHSMGRAQGGLGVGLTMVQKLVQMHGGTVEARSAGLGQGSEFIVRLPALAEEPASANTAPAPSTQSSAEAATGRRVLIVDDITDSAESLAELLGLWGHETQTAHTGATALDWARWFRPEVVLLDIGMPGMDGFEVARRLRQIPEMAGAVLVALTGYGQTQDREATRAAGFDQHLVKPVDLDALRNLLDKQ